MTSFFVFEHESRKGWKRKHFKDRPDIFGTEEAVTDPELAHEMFRRACLIYSGVAGRQLRLVRITEEAVETWDGIGID